MGSQVPGRVTRASLLDWVRDHTVVPSVRFDRRGRSGEVDGAGAPPGPNPDGTSNCSEPCPNKLILDFAEPRLMAISVSGVPQLGEDRALRAFM